MKMRSFKASTLEVVSDSSLIMWRNGRVQNGNSWIVRLTPDTARFEPAQGSRGNGYSFVRVSGTAWTALLDPSAPGGKGVVYQMERITR